MISPNFNQLGLRPRRLRIKRYRARFRAIMVKYIYIYIYIYIYLCMHAQVPCRLVRNSPLFSFICVAILKEHCLGWYVFMIMARSLVLAWYIILKLEGRKRQKWWNQRNINQREKITSKKVKIPQKWQLWFLDRRSRNQIWWTVIHFHLCNPAFSLSKLLDLYQIFLFY